MTLTTDPTTEKKPEAMHWWKPERGGNRIACGKQYIQGATRIQSTTDTTQVTCKLCLRVINRKGRKQDPFKT